MIPNEFPSNNINFEFVSKKLDDNKLKTSIVKKCYEMILNQVEQGTSRKQYNFHFNQEDDHYMVAISIIFKDLNIINIQEVGIYSFEDSQVFHDAPTKKEFDLLLNQKPLIKSEDLEMEEVVEEKIVEPPKMIQMKSIVYTLSHELIRGLKGERGVDHQIDLEVLCACLQKKVNALKKIDQSDFKNFDFYFNIISKSGKNSGILNLIIKSVPKKNQGASVQEKHFTVFTAYMMPPASIKSRLHLKTNQYEIWEKALTKIEID